MNFSDIAQAFAIGAVLSAIVFGPLGFAIGVFAVLRSFERMDRQAE
jgi:F0F1-type ATP synthase assembly protein I